MTKIANDKLKKIRKVELAISQKLFITCAVISIIAITMATIEFFSRGAFPPPGISFFYIAMLCIYSIHKEMLRWLEEKKVERQGEWFVYSWIGLTTILYVINFLTKDYFRYSENGVYVESLRGITITTIEVCAVFIVTRLSKVLKISLEKK